MSKHRCPLCKRQGWKAKRRVVKLWREAIKQGIPVLDYSDSPAVREKLREEIKQELFGDKPPPAPGFKETPGWYAMAGYAGGKLMQPVRETPEAVRLRAEERRREMKRASNRRWLERHPGYSRDYYQRKKAEQAAEKPEPDPQTMELVKFGKAVRQRRLRQEWSALDYAEKQNEKLARDREYQRKYYAKNKERIDRLRKERAERRRSPTTGAKANGH